MCIMWKIAFTHDYDISACGKINPNFENKPGSSFHRKCLWQTVTQTYEEWLSDCSIHNSRDWYSKYRNVLFYAVIYLSQVFTEQIHLAEPVERLRNMPLFLCLIVSHLCTADINVSPERLQRNDCKRKVWKTVPPKEVMYCGNMLLEVNTWRCK